MIIHSKFRDYYDTAMAYGVDESNHWVRNCVEYDDTDDHKLINSDLINSVIELPRQYESTSHIIGFCGKLYPVVTYDINRTHPLSNIKGSMYNEADMKSFIRYTDKVMHFKQMKSYLNGRKWQSYWGSNQLDELTTKRFLDGFHGTPHGKIFAKYGIPIFVISKHPHKRKEFHLIINPTLTDYGFQRIIDPYTAFQEIEMYRSGVLGDGNPEPIKIADKYLIKAKGFSTLSFRKLPSKKK